MLPTKLLFAVFVACLKKNWSKDHETCELVSCKASFSCFERHDCRCDNCGERARLAKIGGASTRCRATCLRRYGVCESKKGDSTKGAACERLHEPESLSQQTTYAARERKEPTQIVCACVGRKSILNHQASVAIYKNALPRVSEEHALTVDFLRLGESLREKARARGRIRGQNA